MANVPPELDYAYEKPMAVGGKPDILRFRSDNTSYTGGDTIRIEIPTGRPGMHAFPQDCYIEGKLKTNHTAGTGASSIYLDQSVYSIFQRLYVSHGSNVLEDLLYPNRVWTAMYDLQINESERRSDCITKLVHDNTESGKNTIYSNGLFGMMLKTNLTTITADSAEYDFTLVLPSAIVGSLATKATPLAYMGASSLYINLELAPTAVPFNLSADGTINSYTVSDIYYNMKVTQLPQNVESALIKSTGGVIVLPAVAYKAEMKSLPSGSSSFNDKFAFQFASLKNFCFFFTNSANAQGSILNRSVSVRPRCNLSEWNLGINGIPYPSQNINTPSKMYTELLRAYDMLTDTNAGGIITSANYKYDTHSASDDAQTVIDTSVKQKRFIAGVDLDRFNHNSDVLMSGTSSIGQNLTLNLMFKSATTDNVNIYAFVMYDVMFVLNGGLLSASK